jgi:hypothetical protein
LYGRARSTAARQKVAEFFGFSHLRAGRRDCHPKASWRKGEELSSNPLRFVFKGLKTTQFAMDVDRRSSGPGWCLQELGRGRSVRGQKSDPRSGVQAARRPQRPDPVVAIVLDNRKPPVEIAARPAGGKMRSPTSTSQACASFVHLVPDVICNQS